MQVLSGIGRASRDRFADTYRDVAMLIVAYFVVCFMVGLVGRRRRIGFSGYFLLSILLTPIITLLFIILSSLDFSRSTRPQTYSAVCKHCEKETQALTKIHYCPGCGRSV